MARTPRPMPGLTLFELRAVASALGNALTPGNEWATPVEEGGCNDVKTIEAAERAHAKIKAEIDRRVEALARKAP